MKQVFHPGLHAGGTLEGLRATGAAEPRVEVYAFTEVDVTCRVSWKNQGPGARLRTLAGDGAS
ncbi:DUF2378 family protein [Corallococcus llansteffanensis]